MAYGDTKIVINSVTYDNCSNNILIGVRKNAETEDSQVAEVVLDNADQRFTALNLRGLTAVISYDYGSGYVATPTLTVITQDDITSGGHYQTVLSLVGIPDLLAEDKASKDYIHNATDTKTVEALLTEVLSGVAVASTVTEQQTTMGSYYNMYYGSIIIVGQTLFIKERTVSSIQFYLKKVGSPTGNITFYMRPTDYSWTESKVLSDASALSTSPAWCEATLDTPKYVDDEVHIYCEYQGGDASNYVAIGYSAAGVKEREYLGLRYAAGEWNLYEDLDCGYKYSYSVAGIECFTHCTAYTPHFDGSDSLMDFQPKDTFSIKEGESRLSVVNKLLDYTASYKRVQSNGEIYFFVIPASGNSYTSATGDFYSHANRKALVVPNRIVVKSVDYEDDGIEGEATSAASYALIKVTGPPVRATVANSTEANNMAAALIGRLEVNSQVGSETVYPANYEQIWNYVTVTNTWNGSTTTGNIAYLNRVCMGGEFREFYSFGKQAKKGIRTSTPKKQVKLEGYYPDEAYVPWGKLRETFDTINDDSDQLWTEFNIIEQILEMLGVKVDAVNSDLSDNIQDFLDLKVETLKLYIAGIVEKLWVTKELRIPGFKTISGS